MANFLTKDGVRLYYRDEGTGIPILCLAGLTRNTTDFDYAMPALQGMRVIRLDSRGRGGSAWADYKTYTVAQEAKDALALLDHLGVEKTAILGTSRGGLIAMVIASAAKNRLLGVCLNDIGPELDPQGLDVINDYIGRNPPYKTYEQAARARGKVMKSFANVSRERWLEEVRKHYEETDDGLAINYDPKLRDAVLEAGAQPLPDLWPLFDALAGLPLALIRGANSDLLREETADAMRQRRPDMLYANVADRGHIPFLDENDAVAIIKEFLGALK